MAITNDNHTSELNPQMLPIAEAVIMEELKLEMMDTEIKMATMEEEVAPNLSGPIANILPTTDKVITTTITMITVVQVTPTLQTEPVIHELPRIPDYTMDRYTQPPEIKTHTKR
jgi:hypothetical protein